MIFHLCHDLDRMRLLVALVPPEHAKILASRDPAISLVFREGYSYFNTEFKKTELYRLNGEKQLIGLFHGQPAPKPPRKERAQLARCWFELSPVTLGRADLSPDLLRTLNQPANVGVIAQVIRSQLGFAPPDPAPQTSADWLAWIQAQKIFVSPAIKTLFRTGHKVFLSDTDRAMLLTGQAPPAVYLVRVRWVELKEKIIRQRELRESSEWELEVPAAVLKAGPAAVLDFFNQTYAGFDWKALGEEATAVDSVKIREELAPLSGPLFWAREKQTEREYRPVFLETIPDALHTSRPVTINDLINEALKTQQPNIIENNA